MEGGEATESLNDWEQVQPEIILQDDLSVFPPSYHEGLQISPPQPPPLPPSPPDSQPPIQPSSVVVCSAEGEEVFSPSPDSKAKVGNEIGKCLRWRFEILRSGIVWIASRARGGSGFWSLASVSAVFATAVLLYLKLQKWRQWVREESENRLIHLIKEKDQKISQLLLQIAQMNEMLSARRKVPVVRVG
ncbi:hypothetical protein JCGZ_15652 [Jatropha curcas]|uniref:Uncharacterized protein n=1 Tax=Jatropha curcas TaxID=180498 RepID=A0A067L9U4_JATCU|nr:uncharacterized protein LOC105630492 [Jatropha curcas]KDP41245.1 hypothetical protein JCGZ_15652 [Jatropha curcas]